MTDLSRGVRMRRSGRRPGWVLLTALLVLAIGASSALVFTSKVELLKLAVILALWAAVVAAFVSVIYRRQSDVDQARARDLKLVYDLQLDREISARREYELTVESQLRRELASELRAQASDEVSELRAELAALRTNLEILFDAELSDRPALEGERRAVRGYSEWDRENESARELVNRVASVRAEEPARRADDTIIDVHEEPLVPPPPQPQPPPQRQPAAETYHQAYAPQPHEAYAPPRPSRAPEVTEPERGSHWRPSEPETPPARQEPVPTGGWQPPQAPPAPAGPNQRPPEGRGWPQPPAQPAGWVAPGSSPTTGPQRFEPPQPPKRSHRRADDTPPADPPSAPLPRPDVRPQPEPTPAQFAPSPSPTPTKPDQQQEPQQREPSQQQPRIPWPPPGEAPRQPEQPASWQPVSPEGQWLPPGAPGSNWNSGQPEGPAPASWAYDNGPSRDKPSHRAPGIGDPPAETPAERRGRHSSGPVESAPDQTDEPQAEWSESGRRARSRHSTGPADTGSADTESPPPVMSPPPAPPPPPPAAAPDRGPAMSPPPAASARHRGADPLSESGEPPSGGQSVADLLARLQTSPSEGGRRRRRED